jgi:calcineurin-like phosphoesterase family protein
MDWFTADMHFNHENIIEYCHRPFKDVEEMNETMIARFNERVHNMDTVYHIGDFRLGSLPVNHKNYFKPLPNVHELLQRLNGRWVFVRGNHDKNNGVHTILEKADIKSFGKYILLTHKPEDAYKVLKDYDLALVGHVHQNWKFKDQIINVGADVWDFYPVHLKQILKAYNMWKRGMTNEQIDKKLQGTVKNTEQAS